MPVIDLPPEPTVVLTVSEAIAALEQIENGHAPLVIETSQGDRYLAEEVVLDGDNVRLFLGEKVG